MATYKDAIHWIAMNDAAGDTPEGMAWDEAEQAVRTLTTVCLVADVFNKNQDAVAGDVLKARGFRKERNKEHGK